MRMLSWTNNSGRKMGLSAVLPHPTPPPSFDGVHSIRVLRDLSKKNAGAQSTTFPLESIYQGYPPYVHGRY